MAIYLVRRTDHVDWDEDISFVVRAQNASDARAVAVAAANESSVSSFSDDQKSTVEEVFKEGASGVIMSSHKAG
jgi:hypothetical protein